MNAHDLGPGSRLENFLILSAHDYRSPRRANIHFIADQLVRRGTTRFLSLRYSRLSRLTSDPRLPIDALANRVERHGGIDCFLWKTPIHPVNTRLRALRPLEGPMYRAYVAAAGPTLRAWIAEATVIVFESGIAPVFFPLVQRLNPQARTIYVASDDLDEIGVADYVKRCLQRAAPLFDTIRLPSRALARGFPGSDNLYFIPHGIDPELASQGDPCPYGEGLHAVSVGSMRFDADFFTIAARLFPRIRFHVIGCGQERDPAWLGNVQLYPEMPHAETLRYIKHADFGIAPYRGGELPAYLADSSMKLIQYDFFGVPAVCPEAVTGGVGSRFGYRPGDGDSIIAAIRAACLAPHRPACRHLGWDEVTDRLLQPRQYADTRITAGGHSAPAGDEATAPPAFLPIAGFPVLGYTQRQLTDRLVMQLARKEQTCLFFANTNFVLQCATLLEQLNRPGMLIANDGLGMDIAARLAHGRPFPENLNGTDFVPPLLARIRRPAFLVGGAPGVAERAGERLRTTCGVPVVGVCDGFTGAWRWDLSHRINASGAEVVLVAMGNPQQEEWILSHRRFLEARLLIGVGALFDFLAGDKPRAPAVVRRIRLEWLYRLSLEPRRLLRRYTLDIIRFLARCWSHRGVGIEATRVWPTR
jgi:2-beta-glucuronyltransferase